MKKKAKQAPASQPAKPAYVVLDRAVIHSIRAKLRGQIAGAA